MGLGIRACRRPGDRPGVSALRGKPNILILRLFRGVRGSSASKAKRGTPFPRPTQRRSRFKIHLHFEALSLILPRSIYELSHLASCGLAGTLVNSGH